MAVVLRDDAAALGVALHGNVVGHGVAADDGCAGMHSLAADLAFDGKRRIDDGTRLFFGFVGILQVGIGLDRLGDADAQFVADQLAQPVARAVAVTQYARGVPDGILRLQLAEGDNACDVVFAIDISDMVDDVLAILIVEVDVDIGHLHAFRGKEAFEDQSVWQGVQVRDLHGVGDDGAGSGTTARADTDAVFFRPLDIFLNDKEVRGEALLQDDAGFMLVAVDDFLGQVLDALRILIAIAEDQSLFALLAEPGLFRFAFGKGETRENGIALEFDVAFLGDFDRGIASLGEIAHCLAHFLFRLHIELLVRECHTIGIVQLRTGADADHQILGSRVFLRQVMEIVGGGRLQTGLARNFGKLLIELVLGHARICHDSLILKLDVKIPRFEDLGKAFCPNHRIFELAVIQKLRDDAADAGARADKPLRIPLEHI